MKSFRLAAFILIIVAAFSLCESLAETNADNNSDNKKSFKVNKWGVLKVTINSGDISIESWSRSEVYVKVIDADENQNNLSVYQSGNNVIVQNNNSGYYSTSDIKVFIPVEYNLELKSNQGDIVFRGELKGNCQASTGGGDISLGNIYGYINLKTNGGDLTTGNIYNDAIMYTNGGDITTGNITGKADIQTMGGTIKVGNVGKYLYLRTNGGDIDAGDIGGSADVSTMGGSINVKKVSGSAKLNTNGGDIKILGSSGYTSARTYGGNLYIYNVNGTINANTSSGDIYAELKSISGQCTLETMSGSIKFYVDPNIKATINASAVNYGWGGAEDKPVNSDFPPKSYDANKYSGRVSAAYKLNGGGETITLKTVNGMVEIRKLRK